MNNEFYDIFKKSFVEKDKINYVIEEVMKMYPKESGWIVKEPKITENPDGKTVTMEFELIKLEKTSNRSR